MENETNPNIDKDIIIYGLNSAIEQGVSIITAIILGWLFGLTLEIIVFMVSFTFIRTYAGGYHCKKAINCYFISSSIILVVLIAVKYIPQTYMPMIGIASLIISGPILLKLAPQGTDSRQLENVEKKYFKKKLFINLAIECILMLFLMRYKYVNYGFIISIGIGISTTLVVLGKYRKKIKTIKTKPYSARRN